MKTSQSIASIACTNRVISRICHHIVVLVAVLIHRKKNYIKKCRSLFFFKYIYHSNRHQLAKTQTHNFLSTVLHRQYFFSIHRLFVHLDRPRLIFHFIIPKIFILTPIAHSQSIFILYYANLTEIININRLYIQITNQSKKQMQYTQILISRTFENEARRKKKKTNCKQNDHRPAMHNAITAYVYIYYIHVQYTYIRMAQHWSLAGMHNGK